MTARSDDDLFQESTMTFGEHLEELRGALFRAIVGLAIGFLIGCFAADTVVKWIQSPVIDALKKYEASRAKTRLEEEYGKPLPPEISSMLNSGYVPAEMMLIEPFGVLERLEDDYPDQFSFNLTPHKFVPGDLRNEETLLHGKKDAASGLAKTLVEEAEKSASSPGKELWERLTSQQQQFLRELAEAETSSEAEQRRIIRILNELIEDDQLHRAEALNEMILVNTNSGINLLDDEQEDPNEGIKALRDKRDELPKEFTADDSRRLNRLLMANHLHDYLHPPQRNVVELPTWKPVEKRLQALRAEEAFMIWIKAALVTGAVISSPWIFYQVWLFVAAGLYPHEKKYVYMYLPISLGLFLAGAFLAFRFVFGPVLNFLFSFNKWMNIDPDPRIGEWLGFVLFLPIGFGISFQLPLVMLFLNRIGIFTVNVYLEKWRIAVLVIFVISMFLTPADPVSMMLMAVPLTVLYFAGIAMCRWMPKGRSPFDEAYEPS